MGAYEEIDKVIFSFAMEAAQEGGKAAVDKVEYGHAFHFEDADAIKYLLENSSKLSETTLARLKGNLDATIIEAVRSGKSIDETIKDVNGIFSNLTGYEAERIARTEIARGVNNGALAGYRSLGVETVEVYANAGACPECMAHHGDLVTVGEARGVIPRHPNCYCFWLPRPDITNPDVAGWKAVGEISNVVVKGLGLNLPFRGTAMSPDTLNKIYEKSPNHLKYDENVRYVIENADRGFIDEKGAICLVSEMDGEKGFTPIKITDDYGMIVLTGYKIKDRQLERMLRKAGATYGF